MDNLDASVEKYKLNRSYVEMVLDTYEDIKSQRLALRLGGMSYEAIASLYGVSKQAVWIQLGQVEPTSMIALQPFEPRLWMLRVLQEVKEDWFDGRALDREMVSAWLSAQGLQYGEIEQVLTQMTGLRKVQVAAWLVYQIEPQMFAPWAETQLELMQKVELCEVLEQSGLDLSSNGYYTAIRELTNA